MSRDSPSTHPSHAPQHPHTEIEMTQMHHAKPNQAGPAQPQLKIGIWFFEAYYSFQFSVSTLYLALSLLDRLRKLSFKVEETEKTLFLGTIILLTSKFNEVRQLQIKRINKYQGTQHTQNQYSQMQGRILWSLNYVMFDQQNVYNKLSALHYKYIHIYPERVELFTKLHLQNEETRRYGNGVFIDAVDMICSCSRLNKSQRSRSIKEIANLLLGHEEKYTS